MAHVQASTSASSTGSSLVGSVSKGPRPRSALKRREKLDKLERKRQGRQTKASKAERAAAVHAELAEKERAERADKRYEAHELTKDLHPVTDSLLESIYTGLIEARPDELALPEPLGKERLRLPLPTASSAADQNGRTRHDRLALLRARLEDSDQVHGDEDIALAATRALDRVKQLASSHETDALTSTSLLPVQDWSDLSCELVRSLRRNRALARFADLSVDQKALTGKLDHFGEMVEVMSTNASEGAIEQVAIDTLAVLADRGDAETAMRVLDELESSGLPVSVSAHHYAIESLLPHRVEAAIEYLHKVEQLGLTPLQESYASVIATLVAPSSPPHLVARGWDLFAHSRLVSHAVPSTELYATMIEACARGRASTSAERAVDLFVEMTHDNGLAPTERAYNALIRACARDGSVEAYNEALRYLRQMLDENVRPTRATFHAVLEGARRQGDLARARWILVKMIAADDESCAPDASSLGLVLQAYANYRVPHARPKNPKDSIATIDAGAASSDLEAEEANASLERFVVQFVSDGNVSFPGPMPQSKREVLDEARLLFTQAVERQSDEGVFKLVEPTSFLLNSFLQVLCAQGTFDESIAFFDDAYDRLGAAKNEHAYETIMARAERAEDRASAPVRARIVFAEWELRRRANALSTRSKDALAAGHNVGFMWSSVMRTLARNDEQADALALLEAFRSTYAPRALVDWALEMNEREERLPARASAARMASPLYAETTRRGEHAGRPPFITLDMLRLVELRFVEVDDTGSLERLRKITDEYRQAFKLSERVLDRQSLALARANRDSDSQKAVQQD